MKRLAALLSLALAGFTGPGPQHATSPETVRHLMEGPATGVLQALAQRDYIRLASFVGPDGLKLSPYVMLDEGDVRLSRSEVARCDRSRRSRLWGSKDGSGEDIRMTCGRYFANYVWDADYRKADEVLTDMRQRGLEPNNNHGYVPGAVVVEFHIREKAQPFRPWSSLRLVFRPSTRGPLRLIAITRDVRTI
jgi:hypothetical protein